MTDDEIMNRTKKVIERFIESHNGQYPASLDDILEEMEQSTGSSRKEALNVVHKAMSLVQEERGDTELRG